MLAKILLVFISYVFFRLCYGEKMMKVAAKQFQNISQLYN